MNMLQPLGIAVMLVGCSLSATFAQSEPPIATNADDGATRDENTEVPGPPLTLSEKQRFQAAVSACLITEPQDPSVTVRLSMNQDGTIVPGSLKWIAVEGGTADARRPGFEKARRAILRCEKGGYPLPQDKYEQWKDIEMVFNPDGMRLK